MGNWLKVTGFGGVRHRSALGEAGLGRRRKLHGTHGVGQALLLCAELVLVLRQLAVEGYGLGCKKRQVFCAAVPFKGKGESSYNTHSRLTCLPSQHNICFQVVLFLLSKHRLSRQNDQLICASLLIARASNT